MIMLMVFKTSPAELHVSVTILSLLFRYLTTRNVNVDEFLRTLGLNPADFKSPDCYIPVDTYLYIQESAAEYTHDELFGLHMGEYVEAGNWSILGYLMMNCATMGQAFEKSARYSRIIGNMIEAKAAWHFNKIKIILYTPPHAPQMSRHCYDSTLASSVRMIRTLTGSNYTPHQITFTAPAPQDTTEYERIFQCPVLFRQKEVSMLIDTSLLNMPVLMANPNLLAYFEQYAQDFLADIDRENEYTQTVTKIVLAHLDDESLSIKKVAREMAVSVRTLQLHLEEEGVVFTDLMKAIREKLAKQYLRENYSVEQITYMLGFSEPSVFRKAFKKWVGLTPREFRENSPISS